MQGLGVLEARQWAELGHAIGELLETMAKPTVAAVNGYALGGGCEVALACDIRLASTRARLGQPEVNLGIFPGWGGSVRLARTTSLGFAKELVLTGRMVEAEEALASGSRQRGRRAGGAAAAGRASSAAAFAGEEPGRRRYAKEATNLALQGDHRANLATEARLFSMLFATEDQKEGMAAFSEKREPEFRGR